MCVEIRDEGYEGMRDRGERGYRREGSKDG